MACDGAGSLDVLPDETAPSLPETLFEAPAHHLDVEVERGYDPSRSGPRPGEPEPFRDGEVDVAFLGATSSVWLTEAAPAPIGLVRTANGYRLGPDGPACGRGADLLR